MRRAEVWEDTDKEATRVMISLAALKKLRRSRKTLEQVIQKLEKVALPTGPFRIVK
jgi:hypothetical protein